MSRRILVSLVLGSVLACGRVEDSSSGASEDAATDSPDPCPVAGLGVLHGERCPVEGAQCSWSCGELMGPYAGRSMSAKCQAGAWQIGKMAICRE